MSAELHWHPLAAGRQRQAVSGIHPLGRSDREKLMGRYVPVAAVAASPLRPVMTEKSGLSNDCFRTDQAGESSSRSRVSDRRVLR
jgi:hypothetical protein